MGASEMIERKFGDDAPTLTLPLRQGEGIRIEDPFSKLRLELISKRFRTGFHGRKLHQEKLSSNNGASVDRHAAKPRLWTSDELAFLRWRRIHCLQQHNTGSLPYTLRPQIPLYDSLEKQ